MSVAEHTNTGLMSRGHVKQKYAEKICDTYIPLIIGLRVLSLPIFAILSVQFQNSIIMLYFYE